MVGIDAFDLKEDEIDITPWLAVLSDGKPHSYEIRVMGLIDDGKGIAVLTPVGSYWVVSGKMFLWLDAPGLVTTGTTMAKATSEATFFVTSKTDKLPNGTNSTLNYQVLVQRQMTMSSTLTTSEGPKAVSWTQTLSYSNIGIFNNKGNNQTNDQMTSGVDISSNGYSRKFAYPLWAFSSTEIDMASKNMTIDGRLDRSKNVQLIGNSVFPSGLESYSSQGPFDGMIANIRQNGTAFYMAVPAQNKSVSWGGTEEVLVFSGLKAGRATYPQVPMVSGSEPLYSRHVLAVNGSIKRDGVTVVRNFDGDAVPLDTEHDDGPDDFAILKVEDVVGGRPISGSSRRAELGSPNE
jgi:hypothetical protein